ncbi:hypothetical protein EVAR_44108_1 [Eumeta japonica]|uniref:Uncharacterized protein n=1 Tax=Eumeta variegata TaxID=151549 RepID=A0A4C1X2F5_EUMVA|nr:hypothetical protein EVAR_44108_1 [Eumeta japonica]
MIETRRSQGKEGYLTAAPVTQQLNMNSLRFGIRKTYPHLLIESNYVLQTRIVSERKRARPSTRAPQQAVGRRRYSSKCTQVINPYGDVFTRPFGGKHLPYAASAPRDNVEYFGTILALYRLC